MVGLLVFNVLYIILVIKFRVIDFIYDFYVVGKKVLGEIRDILDKWNNFYKVCIIVDLFVLVWCVYNLVYNQ